MKKFEVKKEKFRLIAAIIAILLITSSVIYTLASQKVTMTVSQMPYIDVVLTKAKTQVDVTSFRDDLLNSLERKGIDPSYVNIEAVEAQTEETAASFSWTEDVSSSIGSITKSADGKNVEMKGNGSLLGKNAIWIIPDGNPEQEFNFGYNINFGDSFNAAGMLLRVQRTGNTLQGYALSFNKSDKDWYTTSRANGAIWEFTYVIGQNRTNFTKTLKMPLAINTSGNLFVKVTDREITVSGGGLASPATYILEKSFGPGYGFFSDHYSHGCSNIGSFTLSNIYLKTTVVKDFKEVLLTPEWRDGSCKALVNVSDATNAQLSDQKQLTEVITRLMNEDIHYVGWGTNANESEMRNTILSNDNKGIFINNSNYTAAIESTAQYIKDVLIGNADAKYIIANEPVLIKIDPKSAATNTADSNYPNGKWKVEHDYNYFENDEGQYEKSGIYTQDAITEFNKPGSYRIYYEDELITQIYAHRRPMASFDMAVSGNIITLTSTSMDLDKQSQNNGIAQEEWSYKKQGQTSWTQGKLTTLDSNSTYIIKLRVKDHQGLWSKEATKYISTGTEKLNPVAQFKITNKTISLYKQLEVNDTSYDPAGLAISGRTWTIKKDGQQVYTGATPLLDYKTHGAGNYTMGLVVTNSEGRASEEFSQSFTITRDVTAPEFIADNLTSTSINNSIDVNLTFTDSESGFKSYKYAITKYRTEPTSWKTVVAEGSNLKSYNSKVTVSGLGKWYLHIKCMDNEGNESVDRVLGVYEIKKGYNIELKVVDSNIGGVKGAKFKIVGKCEDGREIIIGDEEQTTNSNGKISLSKIVLAEVTSLEIINTLPVAGYEQIEKKVVTIDTSTDKIQINELYTSEDIKCNVLDDGDSLSVEIELEKKKFDLSITTEDASNTNIKLSDVEYALKYKGKVVAEGTSVDGVANLKVPIGIANGSEEDFILVQTKGAPAYNKIEDTTLKLAFAKDGTFLKISHPSAGGNERVKIPDEKVPEIIVKNAREAGYSFSVKVNVADINDTSKKVAGVKYKLKVETDTKLNYTTNELTSDNTGNISFMNLHGSGIIKITFMQQGAPEGYEISTKETYITLKNENEELKYMSGMNLISYNIGNKMLYANLGINKKHSTNSIKIKLNDSADSEVGVEGINFEVRHLMSDTVIGKGATDENGILVIDDVVSDGEGDVVYKVVPTDQVSTNIPKMILISIGFNRDGEAIDRVSQVTTNNTIKVYFKNEDESTAFRRTTYVEILTPVAYEVGKTTLIIDKKDSLTKAPVKGAKYKIRISYDGKVYTNSYTTGEDGKLRVPMPKTSNARLKITEVKAAPGYFADPTVKEMRLTEASDLKLVPVKSGYVNIDSSKVTVDGYDITLEENVTSLRFPRVKFNITATDEKGQTKLIQVGFKITNINNGEFQKIATNSSGLASSDEIIIEEAATQVFEIEELNTTLGHLLPSQPFVIRIDFNEDNNIIRYTGETYLKGEELISTKNSKYDKETNELVINMTIKNMKDPNAKEEIANYAIDLEKVDKDGNKVSGSKYDIEVRPFGMGGIAVQGKTVDDDIELLDVSIAKGKSTILLKETQEAYGFVKDEQIKVITVESTDGNSISIDTSSSSYDLQTPPASIKIESRFLEDGTEIRVLKVVMVSKKPDQDIPTGGGGTNIDDEVLGIMKIEAQDTASGDTNIAYPTSSRTYKVEVPDSYTESLVKVTPMDGNAIVTIESGTPTVGTTSERVVLTDNSTFVKINVSTDEGRLRQYVLEIVKAEQGSGEMNTSVNIDKVLITEKGVSSEIFRRNPTEYVAQINQSTNEVDLSVMLKESTSKVSIGNGNLVEFSAVEKIKITEDTTIVPMHIESEDGSETKDYTIRIERANPLLELEYINVGDKDAKQEVTGAVKISDTEYIGTVFKKYAKTKVKVKAKDPTSIITIGTAGTPTAGEASEIIDLSDVNVVVMITIENSDKTIKKNYTLVINKIDTPADDPVEDPDPDVSEEDATFKIRLFDKNDGETWPTHTRTIYNAILQQHGGSCPSWHRWYRKEILRDQVYEFNGEQRLPVFFKDSTEAYGNFNACGKGFYLLYGFSKIEVEARLVEGNEVSDEIYEKARFIENEEKKTPPVETDNEDETGSEKVKSNTDGSHIARFGKDYRDKEVEFTITQEIPLQNHKKFETKKIRVKFDANGKVVSGKITQGLDVTDIAVGGISTGEIVKDIKYPDVSVTDMYNTAKNAVERAYANMHNDDKDWYLWYYSSSFNDSNNINKAYYDEIEDFDSKGKDTLYVGLLNKELDNKFNLIFNLKDEDNGDPLNGTVNVIVSEKDTTDKWKTLETLQVEIINGRVQTHLSNTLANRNLKFTITQTTPGSKGDKTYTNTADSSIELEVSLDDDGNIASVNEINTPSAKLEDPNIGGNFVEYTIFNQRDYNFAIDLTKLDENGNPLPGVRFETTTVLINDKDLSKGEKVDQYGSSLTDDEGKTSLRISLPTAKNKTYYGRTIDISIRETYVPDNYVALSGYKVRVMFTSQGKIATAPELIEEPEPGTTTLEREFQNTPGMAIKMTMQNKLITEKPSFEIQNVNSNERTLLIGGLQYRVTSWDQVEYESDHLTYKEQIYSQESTDTDGTAIAYMDKAHALRTIIYTLRESKTPELYRKNEDIILKVTYDETGKIVSKPEILSTQRIRGDDVAQIIGNPIGNTMINLKVLHQPAPKFTLNIRKYCDGDDITDRTFKVTSQVKNEAGVYNEIDETVNTTIDEYDRIRAEFEKDNKRKTVLYTIFENIGKAEVQRGQLEITFDAYGNIQASTIVDETNPKNYIKMTSPGIGNKETTIRINSKRFRMRVKLTSTDPNAKYSLDGATFDISNTYDETSDLRRKTNTSGVVIEEVGEIYRSSTMEYTIRQVTAPHDYDLLDEDITFNVTFDDNGNIMNCTPLFEDGLYSVLNTVKDDNDIYMEIEIFITPSIREQLKITSKDQYKSKSVMNVDYANYEIKAVIMSPRESEYQVPLEDGVALANLGPNKDFFGKTVFYTIKQTEVSKSYMINEEPIKIAVQYDTGGIVQEVVLQSPKDGSVQITNPVTGESSTSSLIINEGYTAQIDMTNKHKTVMQVENINIEDENEKVPNNKFTIQEVDKNKLYSGTGETDINGIANIMAGPYYRLEDKTYIITNESTSRFTTKPATFTLTYDKDGAIVASSVSDEAKEYLSIDLVPQSSPLYDTVDVRLIVKSTPTVTIGLEAISEATGASITGMKYEVEKVRGESNNKGTATTDSKYIAHADLGVAVPNETAVYQIIEKEVAKGYKYIDRDRVIAKFEVVFDEKGHITNNLDGQRIKITEGAQNVELNPTTDKSGNYDIDLKVKYEETDELTVIIKNINKLDSADSIVSDFTATIGDTVQNGTTDANGDLTLLLGKRGAEERATLNIMQSNVQGSYAQISPISMRLEFDENGKLNRGGITPSSSSGFASENIAYKILQPISDKSSILVLEVYNNPETTFVIENVDQGDESIKLTNTFKLTATTGLEETTFTTDVTNPNYIKLGSVPKKQRVTYNIVQEDPIQKGYAKVLDITFVVEYDQDGLIVGNPDIRGNGISTADSTTIDAKKVDNYTIKLTIKSRKKFGIYLETVDAYNEDIKLGAQVYIREDVNRKNATLITEPGVGTAETELGSNIAGRTLTYELRLQNEPTPPTGINQKYFRYSVSPIYIKVEFDINGNVVAVDYSGENRHECNNCIIETDSLGGVAVDIKIKYIPTLTVNLKRYNGISGGGMLGRTMEVSSDRMQIGYKRGTTDNNGMFTFDGGRIADDDGTTVRYNIKETNSDRDFNFKHLPTDMYVDVTYDDKGNLNSLATNYPEIITMSGEGTRTLNIDIKSSKEAKITLYNSDYFLATNRISGSYVIESSKGETTETITTIGGTPGSARPTPITLGEVYPGEEVTYTIRNTAANYGYELLDIITFKVKYEDDGTITIPEGEFNPSDRLSLVQLNQEASRNTSHIYLEIKSKPLLMVAINTIDKTYKQPVKNMGFEIIDSLGRVNRVDALTNENGDLVIPVATAESNTVVRYTLKHIATKGGYELIEPITFRVQYNPEGTVDGSGTQVEASNIAAMVPNYSEDLFNSSKVRGIKINIQLETKLGIGITKIDEDTGNPLQGAQFRIKEEELVGGNNENVWNDSTDLNGEMSTYTRYINGSVKKVRYTITEVAPVSGYRMIEDTIIEVTFSADRMVQSVSIVQKPDEVTIDPSNDPNVKSSYTLKKLPNSEEMVHIHLTIKNDSKLKFKLVNLDEGFKGSTEKIPVTGSEFNVTVSRNGEVIAVYNEEQGNQVVTNKNGEAIIKAPGTGTFEIEYSQIKAGYGYKHNPKNIGFIKVDKDSNQYLIRYVDSTDDIEYEIDEDTEDVIVYVYNENNLTLNISNVDIDNPSTVVQGVEQKIKAYYGDKTSKPKDILDNPEGTLVYNDGYSYNNVDGNLAIELGNTYQFINKKVVFEIETVTWPNGYKKIGNVYAVMEFDEFGRIIQVTNEAHSKRLVMQGKVDEYQASIAIGFGDLTKWGVKLIEQSQTGIGINGATFDVQTYVDDTETDIGIEPRITTGDLVAPGTNDIVEKGVYTKYGIKTTGTIKINLNEAETAPGFPDLIKDLQVSFEVEIDTTNPEEPFPVIKNLSTNNPDVTVEVGDNEREVVIKIVKEPKISVNITKVDEDDSILQGMEFTAISQLEGKPETETEIGKFTTDENGTLVVPIDPGTGSDTILITLKETELVMYKPIVPITLRIKINNEGCIDTSSGGQSVTIVSGENTDPEYTVNDDEDGSETSIYSLLKGGATLGEVNVNSVAVVVKNILQEGYRPFKFQLVKENSMDSSIKVPNALFQVKATPEVGPTVYKVLSTDENGVLIIDKVVGEGKIKIEMLELEEPKGYQFGDTEGFFTCTIDKSENGLIPVSTNFGDDRLNVDSPNRFVTARIPNDLEKIAIAIHKIDESNGMSIEGATFKLKEIVPPAPPKEEGDEGDEDDEEVEEYIPYNETLTTNSKGIAYFIMEKPEKPETNEDGSEDEDAKEWPVTKEFVLTEEETPQGYEDIPYDNDMRIIIEFDEEGLIADIEESGDGVTLTEMTERQAKIDIENTQKPLGVPVYDVEIINSDKTNSSITIPNASFEVTIKQQEGSAKVSKNILTDEDGKAVINSINGAGDITISINELEPGEGYKRDHNTKTVKLNRDVRTGRFISNGSTNAYPVIDEENNKITIYVSSEKESGVYSLVINKKNEDGELIQVADTEFKVVIGETQLIKKTDKKGQIIINDMDIPNVTDFNITLQETSAPEGYEIVNEIQVLNLTVGKVYDNRVISNIKVKNGEAIEVGAITETSVEINFINRSNNQEDPDNPDDPSDLYLLSDVYKVDDEYVDRVTVYTTIADYLANMKSNGTMTVYNQKGEEITDTTKFVGTGMVIKAVKDDQEISKTIVVVSDVSGDGKLSILDVSKVNMHNLEIEGSMLEGAYLRAADMNGDGRVSILDVSQINMANLNQE